MSETISELRVHMRHVRAAKLCAGGARRWFAMRGLNWTEFLAEGIPAKELLKTKDPFAAKVVAIARKEKRGRR